MNTVHELGSLFSPPLITMVGGHLCSPSAGKPGSSVFPSVLYTIPFFPLKFLFASINKHCFRCLQLLHPKYSLDFEIWVGIIPLYSIVEEMKRNNVYEAPVPVPVRAGAR